MVRLSFSYYLFASSTVDIYRDRNAACQDVAVTSNLRTIRTIISLRIRSEKF